MGSKTFPGLDLISPAIVMVGAGFFLDTVVLIVRLTFIIKTLQHIILGVYSRFLKLGTNV